MNGREDIPGFRAGAVYEPAGERAELLALAEARMPFGRYAGRYLTDLPEQYLLWFKQKGFPEGTLGERMAVICEMKANGLEVLLRPLQRRRN